MRQLERAIFLATTVHAGETYGDEPFINHVKRVAEGVRTRKQKTVAYLHDIVEDTDITLEDLRAMGFSKKIVEAVDAITRRDDYPFKEKYADYIERVGKNKLARAVKIADLKTNIEYGLRMRHPKYDTHSRRKRHRDIVDNRYIPALKYLEGA